MNGKEAYTMPLPLYGIFFENNIFKKKENTTEKNVILYRERLRLNRIGINIDNINNELIRGNH